MSQSQLNPFKAPRFDASTLAWLALLVFVIGVYILGLDGQYVPTNGDELVYTHIARLTAASDHWLPLVSELGHMRNTKPPLLFWQAMVAGDWGHHWTMAALRAPSVLYTVLIAGAAAWTVQLITRNGRTALLAACVYLTFFCTFRFGRTYLTSAPETFWLSVPMFWLLWKRLGQQSNNTRTSSLSWLTHIGFGLAMGLGLGYKSFALVAPTAAALWCAELLSAPTVTGRVLIQTTLKMTLSALIALGVFGLWFVLDPDPSAVWQEFVIGENAGKMNSSEGYWHTAMLGGGFSIWAQLLAYAQNAGMLAFVILGLMWVGLRSGLETGSLRKLAPHHWILLAWLGVWLLVFTLPSQRSARYVIPAMPALAIMVALYWERIGRGWFAASLLVCGLFIAALGRIAWAAHDLNMGSRLELNATLLMVALGLALVVGGLFKPVWTRWCAVAACAITYACFGLATSPLNGAAGHYEAATLAKLQHAKIAVPNGFNGQFERFQFVLPGNQFVPYDSEGRAGSAASSDKQELTRLLAQHDAVVWLQADLSEQRPPCAPDCTVIGSRWEVKGRHQSGEINLSNIWYPQTWLFRREWLVRGARSLPG